MSLVRHPCLTEEEGFPRVSGDEPQLVLMGMPTTEFSPRERG